MGDLTALTGVTASVTDGVLNRPLSVVVASIAAAGAAVTFDEDAVVAAAIAREPDEIVGTAADDGAAAVDLLADWAAVECDGFDAGVCWLLAVVGAPALVVDDCDPDVPVCVPLPPAAMTPPVTWADDDVAPDAFVVEVGAPPAVDVGPSLDDIPLPSAVADGELAAGPSLVRVGCATLLLALLLVADEESFDEARGLEGSALATAGRVTSITPTPKAAANAPTRPTTNP